MIYAPPPLFFLFAACSQRRGGLPRCSELYVSSRSMKMLILSISLSFSLPLCPSLCLVHICSTANPSNAVSPSCLPLHPRHLPSLCLSLSLPPALAAQVMSFFLAGFSSLLPPPFPSLSPPFPISGWLSTAQHPIRGSFFPKVGGGRGMPA